MVTYSPVNPKAAALFRLLTGKSGLTGEFIPGGVLVNPLPFPATIDAIQKAIRTAQRGLDDVSAPPPPPDPEGSPTSLYGATEGEPLPLPGKELEFRSLKNLISALGNAHTAVASFQQHVNRVVNNLVDLCGLTSAYTVSIRKLGLGISINQRATTNFSPVPNLSNGANSVNLGGVQGSGLGQDPAFPQLTTPELLIESLEIPPALSDIPVDNPYGVGFGDHVPVSDPQVLDDYRMLTSLTELLDQTGIPSTILPPESMLAEVNQAAHGETLFKSILAENYGGVGFRHLTDISDRCQFLGVDLSSPSEVNEVVTDILSTTVKIQQRIKDDVAQWGEDALRPPSFPTGRVLQTIYAISRCEGIVNLANDPDLQGILFTCVSPITLQILRA